jgi:hypothetical protein
VHDVLEVGRTGPDALDEPGQGVVDDEDPAPTSTSDSAISGTLNRKLTGTTTPPAHCVAARASW